MRQTLRILSYISRHIFVRPLYLFTYVKNYLNPGYIPDIKYYENIDIVSGLKAGKSLIRLGDGEIYIMNGGGIGYQKYNSKLKRLFFMMVEKYSNDTNYILCLPRVMLEKTNFQLKNEKLLNCWLPFKVSFNLYFSKTSHYGDAFLFYYNETIPSLLENYLLTKHLIYVTNQDNLDAIQGNSLIPFTDVSFVVTPKEDAFTDFDKIKEKIVNKVLQIGKKNCIILAACGPASKAIAYDLSFEGIVTIDVGRGIEITYTEHSLKHLVH